MASTPPVSGMLAYQDCLSRIEEIEAQLSNSFPYVPYHHKISLKTGQGDSAHITRLWWSLQGNSSSPSIGVTYTRRSPMMESDLKTIYKPLSECSGDIIVSVMASPDLLKFVQALVRFSVDQMKNLGKAHSESQKLSVWIMNATEEKGD